MAQPVQRLHYFNGQFLREPDFTAEQQYHMQQDRDHMRLLHTPGISEGLEIPTPPAGATAVTVNAGVAFDDQGRRIVLADNQIVNLGTLPADQTVFVTISYHEVPSNPTDETGVSGNARWTEDPLIEKLAAPPANPNEKIVLARIQRSGTTINGIDRSLRRGAGVKAGNLQAPSLTLTSESVAPSGWVTMNLGAASRADVLGDLRVTGNLTVQGETTVVSTERMQGNVILGDADTDTATIEGTLVTGHSSGRLKIGSPVDIAGNLVLPTNGLVVGGNQLVAAAGNVGIGTATPNSKLDVNGNIQISNASIPMGLMTEVGGTTPLLNMSVNFREPNVNNAVRGAAFRIDTRGGSVPLFQWISRPAGSATETGSMSLTESGNAGVGTMTPAAKLHVSGSETTPNGFGAAITLENTAAGGRKWHLRSGATGNNTPAGSLSIADDAAYRFVIAPNGNVGIGNGNTTPDELLDVSGRVKAGSMTVGPWPANIAYAFIGSNGLNQTVAANYALLQQSAGAAGDIGRTFLNSPIDIRFRIDNADRMVLNANGNLSLLAGVNPLNITSAWSGTPDGITNGAEISNDIGTFKTLMIVGNRSNGGVRRVSVWDRLEVNGELLVTGNAFKPGGGSWTTTSDQELKKDIAPIDGALEKILQLRGVSFAWREPEQHNATEGRYMGMVAQEVEKVFPEWVKPVPSGHKGLDPIGFEALVIEALRELSAKCERLEAEVAQLRASAAKPKAAASARKKG